MHKNWLPRQVEAVSIDERDIENILNDFAESFDGIRNLGEQMPRAAFAVFFARDSRIGAQNL